MANGYTTTQTPPGTQQFQNPYQMPQFSNPYQSQQFQNPYQTHQFSNPYQQQYPNPYQQQQFSNPYQMGQQGGMGYGSFNPQDWASIIGPIVRGILPVALSQFQGQSPFGGARFGIQGAQPWGQSWQSGGLNPQELPHIVSAVIQGVLPAVLSLCQGQSGLADSTRFGIQGAQPWGQNPWGQGLPFGSINPQVLPHIVGSVIQGIIPAVLSLFQSQPALTGGMHAPMFA